MESEEEMIQRLIKEGLTKTETEEDKIQRLVKVEITRDEINKKWETKKRQALATTTWQNTILPALVLAIMLAYAFERMQIVGWTIPIAFWAIPIAFFIIVVALYYYFRNNILKVWESPESYE